MTPSLAEQLKHFLTAGDTQADLYGANSIANLVANLNSGTGAACSDIGDILTEVQTISTDLMALSLDVSSLVTEGGATQTETYLTRLAQEATQTEVYNTSLQLTTIQTDAAFISSKVTEINYRLARGRTNFGGRLEENIHVNTTSGSYSGNPFGSSNGVRVRKVVFSWPTLSADLQFRWELDGQRCGQYYISRQAPAPLVINLQQFYHSKSGDPQLRITRLAGSNEIYASVDWEDLSEDSSGYPT